MHCIVKSLVFLSAFFPATAPGQETVESLCRTLQSRVPTGKVLHLKVNSSGAIFGAAPDDSSAKKKLDYEDVFVELWFKPGSKSYRRLAREAVLSIDGKGASEIAIMRSLSILTDGLAYSVPFDDVQSDVVYDYEVQLGTESTAAAFGFLKARDQVLYAMCGIPAYTFLTIPGQGVISKVVEIPGGGYLLEVTTTQAEIDFKAKYEVQFNEQLSVESARCFSNGLIIAETIVQE